MVAGALDRIGEGEERSGLGRWVRSAFEAQRGRTFLWAPIGLSFGIWTYFALAVEPSGVAVAGLAAVGLALIWLSRAMPVLALVALLLLGFSLAKLRSEIVATPLLWATTAEVLVTGTVTSVQASGPRRLTIIVAPDVIEGVPPGGTPLRLRLTSTPKFGTPGAGNRIAVKARLAPPPSPVEPGGFDYGRRLWFESIGGTGRVTAAIAVLNAETPWAYRFEALIGALRHKMGERIHASLDGTAAAFAEALITGERSAIPKEVNQSLLVSGLFHILSISGLHMWLVAGGVFWTVRAAFALSPALALRFPIKKWAAAAALLMGLFYMLLADSGVATQRSFIMIAVVFFAVLTDRPALSSRNLAIAAIIVLLFEPEAAIEASFQMSFFAVLGLVAFYESWADFTRGRDVNTMARHSLLARLMRKTATGIAVALATTLIASTMSSIPAAYHFGRLAPYGLIANGLALPVIGFIVMPMALLAAVLMPLGLDGPPLYIMGEGLRLVLIISGWVASIPGAYVIVPQASASAMIVTAIGAALFCLLAGSIRFAGLALVAAGLALAMMGRPAPDILVERAGGNAAIRDDAGQLVPALARRSRFAIEKWLQTNGEEVTPAEAANRQGWTCVEKRCDARVNGKRIAYVTGDEKSAIDCASVDILIAGFPLRGACKAVPTRIDRFDLWRGGAHAIRIIDGAIAVTTARSAQGMRPWTVVPEARKEKFKRP